jgi:predicted PurR-regulated permease PerM
VSVGDFAATVVTLAVLIAMGAMLWVLAQLVHVLHELRETAQQLSEHTLPAVQELRRTVGYADAELDRLHGVIETAEKVSTNLASAGKSAARVVAAPGIKTKALAAGTKGAWSRLRGRPQR